MKTFGEILREKRTKKRLHRELLADMVGVHYNTIVRWERGDGFPNILVAADLANALGCSLDELVGRRTQ